jgi:hypothetical protein
MRILAEYTSGIREFEIKGFILTLGISKDDMNYYHLLEQFKNPASYSKEDNIAAILRRLDGAYACRPFHIHQASTILYRGACPNLNHSPDTNQRYDTEEID